MPRARQPEPILHVVAAAVIVERRLLLVSKQAAPAVFYLPGGKPEPGEPGLVCLRREIHEELSVGVRSADLFVEIRATAALEGVAMRMVVFLAELDSMPAPAAELAALAWWPDDEPLIVAPAVRDHLLPALRAEGRL